MHVQPLKAWLQHVTWQRTSNTDGKLDLDFSPLLDLELPTNATIDTHLASLFRHVNLKLPGAPGISNATLAQLSVLPALRFAGKPPSVRIKRGVITHEAIQALRSLPAWVSHVCMIGCDFPLPTQVYKELTLDMPMLAGSVRHSLALKEQLADPSRYSVVLPGEQVPSGW